MSYARTAVTPQPDSTAVVTPSRTDPYGAAYVRQLDARQAADEGSYYVVETTTPGTGIAGHAAPVAADLSTKPFILLYNGGLKNITPDYVRIRMTAIGAGATTTDFDSWYDQSGATRASSAATTVTPTNSRSDLYGSASGATVYFGATTTVAAVQAKRQGHVRVRSVVPVIQDEYLFFFGQGLNNPSAGVATSGTNILTAAVYLPPIVIAPGANFLFVQWGANQSGAHSMDAELGYWER